MSLPPATFIALPIPKDNMLPIGPRLASTPSPKPMPKAFVSTLAISAGSSILSNTLPMPCSTFIIWMIAATRSAESPSLKKKLR
jgi:hypothetical protein